MMDTIDRFLRINLEIDAPFGGIQLVVFGDLFQLPPVVSSQFERKILKERYSCPYFFAAHVFQEFDLMMIELRTVYRQTERNFINLLDKIRTRNLDFEDMEEVNSRYQNQLNESDEWAITLCSTNSTVTRINSEQLNALRTPLNEFKARMGGEFNASAAPADQFLLLKVGAQVMFVRNDQERRYVNGTLGKVVKITPETITVQIEKEGEFKDIEVTPVEWELLKYLSLIHI